MFLYGAGGHAKSVRDNLRSYDISVDGVYDDNPEKNQFMELKVTHSLEEVDTTIVCVGDNQTRKTVVRKLSEKDISFGQAIHRSAMRLAYITLLPQVRILKLTVRNSRRSSS